MNHVLLATLLSTRGVRRTSSVPDAVAPTAAIEPVSPEVRNYAVTTVTVVFSERVSGVTLAAFELTRNGGADLLTGDEELATQDNGLTWTLSGLGALTEDEGEYELTLTGSGSGIVDAAGNELSGNDSIAWEVDITFPTVTIETVTPDPIGVPIADIDVVFSEPVTGVTLDRFTLKRNGGANLLGAGQAVVDTGDHTTYTITGLTAITGNDGAYVLEVVAPTSAILDMAGNGLAVGDTEAWVVATSGAPTVTIGTVSPDPRSDGVDSISIVFSQAVSGFTLADLTLTLERDGSPLGNQLTPDQTLTSGDNITWTLGNLEPITRGRGIYELTVLPGGITATSGGKALQVGDTESWEAIVEPWAPAVKTFRTANTIHTAAFRGGADGGALNSVNITTATNDGGVYLLTIPSTGGQDWRTGDWVSVEGSSAVGANGFFEIEKTGSTTYRLLGSTYGGNGTGGIAYRWVAAGLDAVQMFQLVTNAIRGNQPGVSGNANNYFVPHGLAATKISGAALVSGTVRITANSHGLSTDNVVEISGLRITLNSADVFQGVWTVTVHDGNTFTLNGAVWPTGAVYAANTGIVRLHSAGLLLREYLETGGADNPSATDITGLASSVAHVRGFKQGLKQWKDWFREHVPGNPGYYISAGNVNTTQGVLERGVNASYPFALVKLDEDFTNGWGIVSSEEASAKLRLTLSKQPKSAWAGKVRAAIFGHSNPSYGLDRFIDGATSAFDGSTSFGRLIGQTRTATGGTATTLTSSNAFLASLVVGQEVYFLSGTYAGQSRTVRACSGNTITFDALPGAVANGTSFLVGTWAYPITAVDIATNKITLDTPYRTVNGEDGCLLLFGNATSIGAGGARPGGGNYARLTTEVAHGLEAGDYVLLAGMSGAGSARYNFTAGGSALDPRANRVTVHKVAVTPSATQVDLDTAYAGAATGGRWFGTCLSLCPLDPTGSSGTRIDQPDYRHPDVRTLFNGRLKSHLDAVFERDGAAHIGVFDENSFRHTASAASSFAISGSLNGETTIELVERVGDVIQHIKDEWCRTATPNCTGWLTKDTLSLAERDAIIAHWGGIVSEFVTPVWDRSVHQLVDGLLAHIKAMTDAGLAFDYQTQEGKYPVVEISTARKEASGEHLELWFTKDAGLTPNGTETAQAALGNPHNHSGQLIGIYGHTAAPTLNGVHRVIGVRTQGTGPSFRYIATLETRYTGAEVAGGTMVTCNCFVPMKVVSLTNNGSGKVRVTTEFPHYLPAATDAQSLVYFWGYAGGAGEPVQEAGYVATPVNGNAYAFDLSGLDYSADKGVGICFWGNGGSLTGDHNHFLGICWMLWDGLRALRLNSGSLVAAVNPWVAYIPDDLSADGDFSVDAFTGTATGGSKTTLTNSGAAFTDAVLGEQLLFTSGPNAGKWRRITAVNSATQITFDTLDVADSAVANGHGYVVGKTASSDPAKALQLSRNFNSGTRRVECYPQKSQVKRTGF